ncbi:SPFH domain-containing protein, partial [Candidatus Pacearchaeota archaeon]|nr:SPFH domain-containing protein [Candidatus Pacearchaeota archaeon]
MEWLNNILETLRNIFPRTFTVLPDEGGIRITLGTKVEPLQPGWYIYWPIIQHVEAVSVTPQAVDLRPQSVRTSEGNDMIIGGAILYRISDARKAILNVQDYDRSVQILALGVIAEYVRGIVLGSLRIGKLREAILAGVREEAAGFGLKIMKVYITDLG